MAPPSSADLPALRAAGWPERDPLRWHLIETLARRAEAAPAPLRAQLQARIAALLVQYPAADATGSPTEPPSPAAGRPLAALLAHVATHAAPAAELQTLQRWRRTWSRLAADQRVVRSRTRLPENAGPLHSQRLVHRALTLMREVSPEYLERFIAHADTLLWLERAGGGDLLAQKDVLQPAPSPKRKARRAP